MSNKGHFNLRIDPMKMLFPLTLLACCATLCFQAGALENGLILDLDADHGISLEDGDRVVRWQNQVADFPAKDFVKQDKGRKAAGSGRPTLKKSLAALNGHSTIQFRQQELVCMDEDAFDHLTTGAGCTWIAVMSVQKQRVGLKDVNSFFGNLRNGALYGGLWGALEDDNTLWWGMRNGVSFGRFDKNNPKLVGPKLEVGKYYVVAGRIAAGTGQAKLDLFVDSAEPVATAEVPINPKENPSKMAIGQERDAIQHPGKESFDGDIARFMIYERPLTGAEMATRIADLKTQYGLAKSALKKGRGIPPKTEPSKKNKRPHQ
jgi:hypothetical protein